MLITLSVLLPSASQLKKVLLFAVASLDIKKKGVIWGDGLIGLRVGIIIEGILFYLSVSVLYFWISWRRQNSFKIWDSKLFVPILEPGSPWIKDEGLNSLGTERTGKRWIEGNYNGVQGSQRTVEPAKNKENIAPFRWSQAIQFTRVDKLWNLYFVSFNSFFRQRILLVQSVD